MSENAFSISPFDALPRDCWLEIDSRQLSENVSIIGQSVRKKYLAVIKANGYGHGYINAAQAFLKGGASCLGVVNVAEGVLLRRCGIEAPVFVMGGMLPDSMAVAAAHHLDFAVFRAEHLDALKQIVANGHRPRVHVKVDVGMGRLGLPPRDALAFFQSLHALSGVDVIGLLTHFPSADDLQKNDDTRRHIQIFDEVVQALTAVGLRPPIVHASNTGGSLYHPAAHYDMVRLGIAAYGLAPEEGMPIPEGLRPAMTWKARFVHTKVIPAGHGVSYGSEYVAKQEMRIGVLPAGYADGYRRVPKNVNTVLVNGIERPVVGRVTMDHIMIDLGDLPDITGEEAVLLGRQGSAELTVGMLAARWGTNMHDVIAGISPRVPRKVI